MPLCCSQKGPRLSSVVECDAFSVDGVHHNSAAPRVLLAGGTFSISVRRSAIRQPGGDKTSGRQLREAGRLTERPRRG